MIAKLALLVLLVAAVSGNPAAHGPWRWIHRRLTVSPNFKALPYDDVVKSAVRPRPSYSSGTVRVDNCGQAPLAPKTDAAIVGGSEAAPHSFPWQVALFIDNMWFCGGSVISEDWIMTAAHCMDGAGFVDVVAGAHDITKYEPSQVTMRSTDSFVHEDWKPSLIQNDIAMIKLPQKLIFNNYIQPVCLPSASEGDLPAGIIVTPTGWGKDHDGYGGTTDTLREVDVPTISNYQCAQTYGSTVTADMICIDGAGGKGTCSGDSGGPLNYKVGSKTETRGIVSFGAAAGCEKGYPDAFTRVEHYLGWIQDNTGVTI